MEIDLEERTLLSLYDLSIQHPKSWKLCFDPKRGTDYTTGFFRIEDFVPRKGARLSLSLNWERLPGDNREFASRFLENISDQYRLQLKKTPYRLETAQIIDFLDGQAAFVVSEYQSALGLVRRKSDPPVRVLQLAYYDESSQRAVAVSLMGHPDLVRAHEPSLRELVFSLNCTAPQAPILSPLPANAC